MSTDRAEVEWLIADTERVLCDQATHGGARPGAGRPVIKRKKGETRRALMIMATMAEMTLIKRLLPEERKRVLLARARKETL